MMGFFKAEWLRNVLGDVRVALLGDGEFSR